MTRNGRRGSAERTGLYVAATMAVVFILLVAGLSLRGGGNDGGGRGIGDIQIPDDIADLTDQTSSGMHIELTDQDDPNRQAGLITAESYEPVSPTESQVEQPRLWYYLRDGRTLHVEAETGRFLFSGPQTSSPPESGRLDGNVTIRLYDPLADGSQPVIGRDTPALTARVDRPLEFDMRNARLATVGRVVVTTPELEFAGSYLTAVINQVKERLELLEVRSGESITYTPTVEEGSAGPRPPSAPAAGTADVASASDSAAGASAPETGEAPTVKIDEYQIAFRDGVEITRDTQKAWADRLDVWLRLHDNRIQEDIFGGSIASSDAAPEGQPATTDGMSETVAEPSVGVAQADIVGPEAPGADPRAPITLRWTGPLVVRPLNETPEQLVGTNAAFRLTAEKSGLVKGEDARLGVTGQMVALEGRAATRELIFSGPGGTVELDWEGTGRYVGSRAQVSFAAGTVHSRGPTVLEGVLDRDSGGDSRGRIRCTEQADFQFSVVDGVMTPDLEVASFLGSVEATDGEARVEGADALTALFVDGPDGERYLTQLDVEGGRASDSRGQSASGAFMRVEFAPGSGGEELDPTRFTARGKVDVQNAEALLSTDELEASLARNGDGDIVVGRVLANGNVDYQGEDQTWAKAEELRGDGELERVTFLGSPAQVGRGGALVSGFEIDLDAAAQRMVSYGPGRFEKDESVDAPERLRGLVWASWEEEMTFDDLAGRIELTGGARAESRPDALTIDSLTSDRVLIEFTPAPEPGSIDEGSERELLRVRAFGRAGPVATSASVETRLYSAEEPERAQQVYFLEGAQIDADAQSQTVYVPSAGKMLSLDRRPDGREGDRPEGMPLIARGPGQALITWDGSMTLSRRTGEATVHEGARIVHQSLLDGRYTELEAEDLLVRFREVESEPGSGSLRGELTYADASGAVYFRNGTRELIADDARYDAEQGVLYATAAPGNTVQLFDPSRPSPIRARSILWNLVTDTIDVNAPMSSAVPIGVDD